MATLAPPQPVPGSGSHPLAKVARLGRSPSLCWALGLAHPEEIPSLCWAMTPGPTPWVQPPVHPSVCWTVVLWWQYQTKWIMKQNVTRGRQGRYTMIKGQWPHSVVTNRNLKNHGFNLELCILWTVHLLRFYRADRTFQDAVRPRLPLSFCSFHLAGWLFSLQPCVHIPSRKESMCPVFRHIVGININSLILQQNYTQYHIWFIKWRKWRSNFPRYRSEAGS